MATYEFEYFSTCPKDINLLPALRYRALDGRARTVTEERPEKIGGEANGPPVFSTTFMKVPFKRGRGPTFYLMFPVSMTVMADTTSRYIKPSDWVPECLKYVQNHSYGPDDLRFDIEFHVEAYDLRPGEGNDEIVMEHILKDLVTVGWRNKFEQSSVNVTYDVSAVALFRGERAQNYNIRIQNINHYTIRVINGVAFNVESLDEPCSF